MRHGALCNFSIVRASSHNFLWGVILVGAQFSPRKQRICFFVIYSIMRMRRNVGWETTYCTQHIYSQRNVHLFSLITLHLHPMPRRTDENTYIHAYYYNPQKPIKTCRIILFLLCFYVHGSPYTICSFRQHFRISPDQD